MLRRFVPLLVCLTLAIFVLLARLWDVQVVEHDVWAKEAANIVRSYGVEPYRRGAIRDRNGDLIVRDEKRYVLEFVWRDFRRAHPLGQIAMLRSLALARPVGLVEARQAGLERSARGFVLLTPNDLEDFAKGKELEAEVDYVPPIAAETERVRRKLATRQRRRSRTADMRFYIQRLLELSPREVKNLQALVDDEGAGDLPYIQLAAQVRNESAQDVYDRLIRNVKGRDLQLAKLAERVEWDSVEDGADPMEAVTMAGDRLVALIEQRRRDVDNETADALFRIAAGFSPSRLDERNLAAFDLQWLRVALDWDETRLAEWRASRGNSFVDATRAGFVIARSKRPRDEEWVGEDDNAGDRVVSSLAHMFRAEADVWERTHRMPDDWRRVDEFEVLGVLEDRLARGDAVPVGVQEGVFAFQSEAARTAALSEEELLEAMFGNTLAAANEALGLDRPAKQLVELAGSSRSEWDAEDAVLAEALLTSMHAQLQRRVAAVLAVVADEDPGPFGVKFGDPWIERAMDTRRYVVRDRGARPKKVGREPSTELVLLVTRYREEFAGFRARATTKRIPIAIGPDGVQSVASKLIGKVRSPFLVDVLQERSLAERLIELQRKRKLLEEDAHEILELVDSMSRPGEAVGGSGIESWLDDELSGKSGYHEVLGLQDRVEGNRAPIYRGAVDGLDVTLTLDIALQRAAEEVLMHPRTPPAHDLKADERWFRLPVGAIVLAKVDGEILASASVPLNPREAPDETDPWFDDFAVTDGQSLYAYDRTLTRPTFQPPGSVVKPLLAAYALQFLGLDPDAGFVRCWSVEDHKPETARRGHSPKQTWRAGYGAIDCNSSQGHSRSIALRALDLREALMRSCNVYFAALGEERYDAKTIREAYGLFGFGRQTGVRHDEENGRSGLVDSSRYNPLSVLHPGNPLSDTNERARQFLANGLAGIDANVVQVARAYAGLATGSLPEMRLIKEIGDEPVPRRTVGLGIESKHLRVVRDCLKDVVHHPDGTANDAALGFDDLGFMLAAKTGSADYQKRLVPKPEHRGDPISDYVVGMRKHAWLAGWFPADEPRYVIVVYLHDTSATASHTAVYVAKQFLETDAVKALMGVGGDPAAAITAAAPDTANDGPGEGR